MTTVLRLSEDCGAHAIIENERPSQMTNRLVALDDQDCGGQQ
jgi:hypothetical protein